MRQFDFSIGLCYYYVNIPARPLRKHAHFAGLFFMAQIPFSKQAISYNDQLSHLEQKGLIVKNKKKALNYLETVGYYRLRGYMVPFFVSPSVHRFKQGITFEKILDLYKFDRELRILVFSAIEKIEVAVRGQLVYNYSMDLKNPFWLNDSTLFTDQKKYNDTFKGIKNLVSKSKDVFISHFFSTYSDPVPPSWMTFEVMQMGQLSVLYEILAKSPTHKNIATYFGVTETVLVSWLHMLVYVRNVSAHHARLWNKKLRIAAKMPQKTIYPWVSPSINLSGDNFYSVYCVLCYLLRIIAPNNNFSRKFKKLLRKYKVVNPDSMGFPKNWKREHLL